MPTPENVRLFYAKRGIPVRRVRQDGNDFMVEVTGKGKEALEYWGASAEKGEMTISEVTDSRLRQAWGKGVRFITAKIRRPF